MRQYFASDYAYGINSAVAPLKVSLGTTVTGAATSYTLYESTSVSAPPSQENFSPLATNAPVLVGTGTIQETLTPSAVTNLPIGQNSTVTFTPTNAHGNGTNLASGSAGLQEALNFASLQNGGTIIVDGKWVQYGGTTAIIAAAANGSGSASVNILDLRGAAISFWTWNGTAWTNSASGGQTVAYAASGAITIADQTAVITKSSAAAAMTLAAPTAAQEGIVITVTSQTAQAHTITATSLLNNGGAGVPYTTATFAAHAGASIQFRATNLLWNVLYASNVTLT